MEIQARDGRKEANPRLLLDDYVKFLRWGQWRIEQTGQGILAFITNHGYLDNPTFRGMRERLMKAFDLIYIVDLHGNTKKREVSPDGSADKNVFDIQQGVAIGIFAKLPDVPTKKPEKHALFHSHLWGTRQSKYKVLLETNIAQTTWTAVEPHLPFNLFVPQDNVLKIESDHYWSISEVMPLNTAGVKTNRDHLLVDFDKPSLAKRIQLLASPQLSDDEIRQCFNLADSDYWNTARERAKLRAEDWQINICDYLYRPFDVRTMLYQQNLIEIGRGGAATRVMGHMRRIRNLALCLGRQGQVVGSRTWNLVLASKEVTDTNLFYRGGIQFFPLYLCSSDELHSQEIHRPNLSPAFLKALAVNLKLPLEGPHGLPQGITPEDIFHYAYAVFHSPTYRTRYAELLKIDFPRLPLTSDANLFHGLAAKGVELVALHLMESPKLEEIITGWPVKGDNVVGKVQYTDKDKRVWINKTQYFGGVPTAVWEFHIGGYQVCDKWLKDRKGRALSYDDIMHYQKIIVALNETIRLMREIDEIVNEYGGWPKAFQTPEMKATTEPAIKNSHGLAKAAEDKSSYGKDKK